MLQQVRRCGLPKSIHMLQHNSIGENGVCKDANSKGAQMFEDAKKEYDQAIDRNITLGELANQKTTTSRPRPYRVLSKVIIFSGIAIVIALLIIL